jgi:predicted nucleic acid-binding protein
LIVVDTTVWVDWFNGRDSPATRRLRRALDDEDVALTGIILTETLQGFRTEAGHDEARAVLTALPMLTLDTDACVEAARLARHLRRRGVSLAGVTDCLIAQCCIGVDAEILSGDQDFALIARHSPLRLCRP